MDQQEACLLVDSIKKPFEHSEKACGLEAPIKGSRGAVCMDCGDEQSMNNVRRLVVWKPRLKDRRRQSSRAHRHKPHRKMGLFYCLSIFLVMTVFMSSDVTAILMIYIPPLTPPESAIEFHFTV